MKGLIKIYGGRRSVCMADDVLAPNPFTFYLPDHELSIQELIDIPVYYLPEWTCYLGEYSMDNIDVEDGILVEGKINNHAIVSVRRDEHGRLVVVDYVHDWWELIKEHPYLYFE